MNRRHLNHLLLVISLGLAVFVIASIFTTPDPVGKEIHSLESWQLADTPSGFPRGVGEGTNGWIPGFDHRFVLLDAFERFQVPTTPLLSSPMGSESGALTYNAQRFREDNPKRGGLHAGDDLNGIGGRNTDLGDPVFAVGNGRVLYAGVPSPGWGNTVIVGHRLADGRSLHSMYAHLQRIDVIRGTQVARGEQVGTVGTADGRYLAHLHFEMRESDSIDLGAGYTRFDGNRLDPTGTVEQYRDSDPAALGASAFRIAHTVSWEGNLILENAHLLPELREDERPRLRVVVAREGDAATIAEAGGSSIVTVRSRSGIGSLMLGRTGAEWPEKLVLRMHLKGLERLRVSGGAEDLEVSLSSAGGPVSRAALRKDGREIPLDEDSPFWSAPRIVAEEKKIPVVDGYIEWALPAALLEGDPAEMKVEWIDFFR